MPYNNHRAIISQARCYHYIMVHNIAQFTFFLNGLPGDSFRNAAVFNRAGNNIMLMGIYHILACYKTDQQYPRTDNMIFTIFQPVNASFTIAGKSN